MSIEKAFAIHAPAPEVYAAIERDLGGAAQHEGAAFAVLRRDPPRGIDLRVTIGGVSCWLTYRLDERDGTTDVTGVLTPFGLCQHTRLSISDSIKARRSRPADAAPRNDLRSDRWRRWHCALSVFVVRSRGRDVGPFGSL